MFETNEIWKKKRERKKKKKSVCMKVNYFRHQGDSNTSPYMILKHQKNAAFISKSTKQA